MAKTIRPNTAIGLECYSEAGSIGHVEPLSDQRHLLFPAIDVHAASGWDLNIGVGRGLTGGSEHWVVKAILGVRLPGQSAGPH